MRKISKLWQRWVIDVILNHTPPLISVIIGVFISVFAVGYWCAHWVDQVDLASYKPYDVFSDNVVNRPVLNVFQDILPIDIVYTWVNGSDPLLIKGLRKAVDDLKAQCPLAHCVPAPYIALEQNTVYTSVLAGLFGIEKVLTVALKHGTQSKNFTLLQMSANANRENTFSAVKIAVGNATHPRPTYWTSDLESGYGLQVSNNGLLILPDGMHVQEALHKLTMGNDDILKDCAYDVYQNTAVIKCTTLKNMDLLYNSSKILSKLSGPQPAVLPSKLMVWMDYEVEYKERDINRYEDNEELRYSLRSLEKYAPWVRKVFIVTNGQIPHWLNLDHPRVKIVTHDQIFLDQSHLPTYSSPAIESHIHRIPGLSENFLYLNDDSFFGLPVWPEDFYSQDSGYKIYLSWRLPDCAAGCPGYWIGDGYCDQPCNTSKCNWDGGDCSKDREDALMKDDDEDNEQDGDCAPNCSDVFLADSYCDMGCNTEMCGYDTGDCGVDMVSKLYLLQVPQYQNTTYNIPEGKHSAWMNISALLQNKTLMIEGKYEDSGPVRKLIINTAQEIMVVVLRSNYSGYVDVTLNVMKGNSTNVRNTYNLKINYNTEFKEEKENSVLQLSMKDAVNFTFNQPNPGKNTTLDISIKQLDMSLVNANASGFNTDVVDTIIALEETYLLGQLTEKGLRYKKNKILNKHFTEDMRLKLVYYSNNKWPPKLKINETVPHNTTSSNNQQFKIIKEMRQQENQLVMHNRPNSNINANESKDLQVNDTKPGKRALLSMLDKDHHNNYIISRTGHVNSRGSRRLLDMFSESLLYVNNLYNEQYGFDSRKVVAHGPLFINKAIMYTLQDKFSYEFDLTSSHKTRQVNDMQFAFSYFYYIIGEKERRSLSSIFDEYDTDESGTWSDREIRTFLSRANKSPPLHFSYVQDFNLDVFNCSRSIPVSPVSTPLYERYADSNLPTVSKELVLKCPRLSSRLKVFEKKQRYPHKTESSEHIVHFKMISSNVSSVVGQLEDVRRNPRKFVCLNNNLDQHGEENDIVHALIEDTFRALFPIPSQFELPVNYRNRFLYTHQLDDWRQWRNLVRALIYASLASLIVLTLVNFFSTEIEALKRRWCMRRRRREKLGGVTV